MTESPYTLYLATNVFNGKQYVGMSKEFHKRLIHHKCARSNSAFHQAIREYGFDNFVFSHIADAFDLQAAGDLERMLIQQHNTLSPNGYNLTVGGQVGPLGLKHTAEAKKKIGQANFNRPLELQEKFKYARLGATQSQDTRDKISKASKGRKHTPEAIAKIKASWEQRKAAKMIASTMLTNLIKKEAPNGVTS